MMGCVCFERWMVNRSVRLWRRWSVLIWVLSWFHIGIGQVRLSGWRFIGCRSFSHLCGRLTLWRFCFVSRAFLAGRVGRGNGRCDCSRHQRQHVWGGRLVRRLGLSLMLGLQHVDQCSQQCKYLMLLRRGTTLTGVAASRRDRALNIRTKLCQLHLGLVLAVRGARDDHPLGGESV